MMRKRPVRPEDTLVGLLRHRAKVHPCRLAFGFMGSGGVEHWLSYGGLDLRARAVASRLQRLGLCGERVVLVFPSGLEYITAFLGCLYAGAVAVPVYPPRGGRGRERLRAVLADARPALILCSSSLLRAVERLLTDLPAGERPGHLVDRDITTVEAAEWRDLGISADTLAFLQYTSGSTSTPKGVRLSHSNLVANQAMIQEAFGTTGESVVVTWLPLFHDMGLIGGVLHPLYLGTVSVLMTPEHFLQRPLRWLRAISRHRATVSGGPDFAYALCSQKLAEGGEESEGLDLGRWTIAFNGAEPVRAKTLEGFAAAFAEHGFDRRAFFPCFGLAEATLLVSGGKRGREPSLLRVDAKALEDGWIVTPEGDGEDDDKVRQLVSCGRIASELVADIVDPSTGRACSPGRVGEIWLSGPTVGQGYWRLEEETRATFGAERADASGAFLRTGDLGFVQDGELFITGRIKDLIILRGRNLYPTDIESVVERSHEALRAGGGGAAFSVEEHGVERLVLVQEVGLRQRPDEAAVIEAIRRTVGEEFDAQPTAVVLIRAGTLPRTTSGKVQRGVCRALYLAGELETAGEWSGGPGPSTRRRPRTPGEEAVARSWAAVLGLEVAVVAVDDNFFASGGDSLRGNQLLARLVEEWGVTVSLAELFDTPTVAGIAGCLERALRAAEDGAPPAPPLVRRAHGGAAPLAFAQRRLWFLDQMEPGNPAYNLAFRLCWRGPLRTTALARALAAIRRRHESLRTVFRVREEGPVQVVGPPPEVSLPVVDLRSLPLRIRRGEAACLQRGEARRPFDLATGPLLRCHLEHLGDDHHELFLSLHHIVSDGWSIGVLVREVVALYRCACDAAVASLAELPLQYGDFAHWQHEWLVAARLEPQVDFWRRRLAGRPAVLELPADRPRPAVRSFRGAHHLSTLEPRSSAALEGVAAARGASLFMVLVAAWQVLLHRLTGEVDLAVGTAVANRDRVGLEGLIGFFANTLVLRADLSGRPTFRELLEQVKTTVLEAHAHRDVPFERLVDELHPARDLAHTPLVQVMLVLQNTPMETGEIEGVDLVVHEVDNGTARFDLALSILATDEGLVITWRYNRDLFDPTTIRRFAGFLSTLLRAVATNSEGTIDALPLLGDAERHQVVTEWNSTGVERTERGGSLQGLCGRHAAGAPEAVALVFEDRAASYGEVARRVEELAVRLRAQGVGPESVVGVLMERSLELEVALLAILEAGGAYLPLDPSYPTERLAFKLEDTGAEVLLIQDHLTGRLPLAGQCVLSLTGGEIRVKAGAVAAGGAAGRRRVGVSAANAAYVIYTSGSTGRPKGVVVPHDGIWNRLLWMQEAYGLEAGETVLQKTPMSFDVSVWEFFWPLMVGARLVLARPEGHRDSAYLAELIARERVSTLHFVPSMLQVFLEEPRIDAGVAPRRVIVSGEALPAALEERFFRRLGAELHNLYGPTEASVDVTFWACSPSSGWRSVPIGRPIANTGIHLLDRRGRPVPIGVAGELHIAGVGLARGYLRRPRLTAERFVPDASSGVAGGRLYRTGDLARFTGDGLVEYLGRLDHQVKVRGVRIELGEIEAAVESSSAVVRAVVLLHGDGAAQTLVAHVVPRGDALDLAALRAELERALPEVMVPKVFLVVEDLPLTPSGKVDRRALPAPEAGEGERHTAFVAPRTPVEERLAVLWREQLGLGAVGVEDDFFELGGDSIQGALLINRLQRELGAIVYVMALFDAPTIARMARYLEESYAEALAAAGWRRRDGGADTAGSGALDAAGLAAMERELAPRFSPLAPTRGAVEKNPPAVFILSPFRSGSTLLRVMLAGHPGLFAPPELELLAFENLAERRAVLGGRDRFAREGLLRAVMELLGVAVEEAEAWVEEAEREELSTRAFYRRMQHLLGGRMLIDKTPRYALYRPTLERAERDFDGALYIHLVRHPGATIHSFVEARMDRVYPSAAEPEAQAEMYWLIAHRNIIDFLEKVPARRVFRLCFEELVAHPEEMMEALCGFLGLDFVPAVADPYQGERMTDGVAAAGRMMGDPTFHRHRRIDRGVVERFRESFSPARLSAATWDLAVDLGYAREGEPQDDGPQAPVGLGIQPRDGTKTALPLSFDQQRLWFLERLGAAGPTYNMPAAVRLDGFLRLPALARCFQEIERRHEALRTLFPQDGGRPSQVVQPPRRRSLPVVDLSDLPAARREAWVRRLIREEARRVFDLARGPLLRLRLLRLGPRRSVLLVNMHHIVSDGWSIGVLVREVAALYPAFCRGEASSLDPLPIQYADFALWQREWLAGETQELHLAYWRRQLAGPLPVLRLPVDRPRPAVQSHRGTQWHFTLEERLCRGLAALGQRFGVTLFTVLLASFKVLLRRYGNPADLLVGTPVANRNRLELEPLIGLFVNTVVLRNDLSGDPSFRELFERVRKVTAEGLAHQEMPFGKLVEELKPPRDLSHSPFFQVLFVLQNTPSEILTLPGLTLEVMPVSTATAKFDLSLVFTENDGALEGYLEYTTDLFDGVTVKRFFGHLRQVLEGMLADPMQPMMRPSLLPPAERHQVRAEWNDRATERGSACLHHLFSGHAERRGQAIAVVYEDYQLSYGALNRRSNRLAHRLVAAGVGPDVLVGLCAERSVEMMIGLLAIVKAGGAYVPLDPHYPSERLRAMLEEIAAPVWVGQRHLLERLGVPPDLVLDPGQDPGEAFSVADPPVALDPRNLAYAIYTSGSTGKPKGAMIPHGAIQNRVLWQQEALGLEESETVLQKTPYSFDVSVWEFFWPMVVGARLVFARPGGHQDSAYLRRLIAAQRASTLHFVPSMLQLFLREPDLGACSGLRRVVASGEALPPELVERFYERCPGALYNLYGPTEAAVDVTFRRCRPHAGWASVPIGWPVAGTRLHVWDRAAYPVALGVPGELLIAGVQLARGYLARPALTAERFVPDPFGEEPGGRLYRTGDLARHLATGEIEFLGRLDHQVKLRGFRIELGEIETVLSGHPAVRETVVVLREDRPGDHRLVAYVVPGEAARADAGTLRGFLRDEIPEYMVPAHFVTLDALPLSANGKVARRLLPAPSDERPDLEASFVSPQNEHQRAIAAVWQQVLGLQRVGVNDNFFDLGGHSLLAAEVQARLEQELQVELSLIDLFNYPTIQALARHLGRDGEDVSERFDAVRQAAGKEKEALRRRRSRREARGATHGG